MKLDKILENFLRNVDNTYHDNKKLKKTYSQTKADILEWVLKQIPEKSIDYDDNYRDGFNACRDLMITKFKEV